MSKVALLTGITGQDGSYLAEFLLEKEYFVSKEEIIAKSDIIIVATPHQDYKGLETSKPVIDIWRITNSESLI